MQFRYYIPGLEDKPSHQDLAKMGLGHLFLAHEYVYHTGCTHGPDGGAGITIGQSDAERVAYLPKTGQLAKKEPGRDWWILYYPDQLPEPEQLRKRSLPGYDVRLADGKLWHVAKIRQFYKDSDGEPNTACILPSHWTRHDDGNWTGGVVQAEFQELWNLALEYHQVAVDAPRSKDEARFQFQRSNELCMLALGVNYRVAAAEIDVLRAYDDRSRHEIMAAVLDMQGFESLLADLEKKTLESTSDPGGGDSPNGHGDLTQAGATEVTPPA